MRVVHVSRELAIIADRAPSDPIFALALSVLSSQRPDALPPAPLAPT
jgi:hypothetical protein